MKSTAFLVLTVGMVAAYGQSLRSSAEDFVRSYTDERYLDKRVVVSGIAQSGNIMRIEMNVGNTVLEFSSGALSQKDDFPIVQKGRKVAVSCICLGRGLKDKQRFFFNKCKVVPGAK